MTNKFKLFNMERTFSNALRKHIELNYESEFLARPWKHGEPVEPDYYDDLTGMLFPVKNPYANLVSYFKGWEKGHLRKGHYTNNMDDILADQIHKMPDTNETLKQSPIHKDEDFLRRWCEKYNTRTKQYIDIAKEYDDQSLVVRFEDFIRDEQSVLNIIAHHFGLQQYEEYNTVDDEIGPDATLKPSSFDKSYYTTKKYMSDITDLQREILEDEIDWNFLECLDYKKNDTKEYFDSAPAKGNDRIKMVYYGHWCPFSGFGRVSRNILLNLPQEDYEIEVLGINFEPANQQERLPDNVRAYPASYTGDSGYGIKETVKYLTQTQFDYDQVFILEDSFIVSQLIGQRQGQPVSMLQRMYEVAKSRGADMSMYFPIDTEYPKKRWLDNVLANTDKAITYTDWGKGVIENTVNNGNLTDDLEVMYHGTDPNDFYETDNYDRNNFLQQFGLTDTGFNIFYLGSNQRRKDIPKSVMGAYGRLFQEYPDTNLWIKIDKNDKKAGHDLHHIRDNQIAPMFDLPEDRINFVGKGHDGYIPKEMLNVIYNMADAVVLPSLEGWGLPVTEAMSTKTPTIVGDHGSTGEMGQDNRSVLVDVPDDLEHKTWYTMDNDVIRTHIDIDDFVEKTGRLIEGKSDVDVEKAYDWIQSYDWRIIAQEWDELFKDL